MNGPASGMPEAKSHASTLGIGLRCRNPRGRHQLHRHPGPSSSSRICPCSPLATAARWSSCPRRRRSSDWPEVWAPLLAAVGQLEFPQDHSILLHRASRRARTPSTGCPRGTDLPSWRGRPTPSGSAPSTGCPRGPAIPGWRGRPAPPGSAPSTGCHRRFSTRRLVRSPSSAGIGPVNWLTKRTRSSRLARSPSSARIRPRQLVGHEDQGFQVGEVAQLRRDPPRQLVAREDQEFQVGEVAQPGRDPPRQLVPPEAAGIPGWRGRPDPPGSAPSTRSTRAAGIPGWRGRPDPPGSAPSTGCYRGSALAGWRGRPAPPGSAPIVNNGHRQRVSPYAVALHRNVTLAGTRSFPDDTRRPESPWSSLYASRQPSAPCSSSSESTCVPSATSIW